MGMDSLARALALKFIKRKADLVNGKIPSDQLPSYVDDVVEYEDLAHFPAEGEESKIYVALDTGFTYRWSGSEYIQIGGQDLSNFVTLDTEQTITAKKTFTWNNPIEFWQDGEGSVYRTRIFGAGYRVTIASYIGNTQTGGITISYSSVSPTVNNSIDLGSDSLKYKDLYLAGNVYASQISTTYIDAEYHKGSQFSPGVSNQDQDLGDNGTHKWNNLYLKGNISDGTNSVTVAEITKKPSTSYSLSDGGTITDNTLKSLIQNEQPIKLNGFTCYFSCDDGTNYQYVSTRYDSSANKNHINVITIDKSTWVATFHTSDIALN